MSIENSRALWLLFLLIPVGVVLWRRYVTGRRELRALAGRTREAIFGNLFVVKWFFSALFFLLFLLLLILSLAGFQWGRSPVRDERIGTEVVLCFDISHSMMASDLPPSRLERSAAFAKALVERTVGIRYSVVVFKGEGQIIVPITEDSASVLGILDAMSSDMMTSPGTDIASGITEAVGAFPEGTDARKIIILFSDGEFLSGNPLRAAEEIGTAGIEVFAVAAGTGSPSVIPRGNGEVLKDVKGNVVRTTLRRDVIEGIVRESDGEVFDLSTASTLDSMVDKILGFENERRRGFLFVSDDRYRSFLLLALICLFLSVLVRVLRWRKVF